MEHEHHFIDKVAIIAYLLRTTQTKKAHRKHTDTGLQHYRLRTRYYLFFRSSGQKYQKYTQHKECVFVAISNLFLL